MSNSTVPTPPRPLGNHCSALRENTLYTFSSAGFLSLDLFPGAKWRALPTGIPTTGGECILAHRDTPEESLYVVGGAADKKYSGLQRFVFAKNKWETIELADPVAFNITNHGATFIEATGQIIIFAGTAWPKVGMPSANTFLINTKKRYEVTSVVSKTPLLRPLVLPWGKDAAVVVGGEEKNKRIRTYTPGKGWKELETELTHGLPARGRAAGTLVENGGEKRLVVFEMGSSPARVRELEITGKSKRRRRRQAGGGWKPYDDSGAPEGEWENVALASEGQRVVISGDHEATPIVVFDTKENAWIDTQDIFSLPDDDAFTITPADFDSPTPSDAPPAASPSPSDNAPALPVPAGDHASAKKLTTVQLLFVILGAIIGFLLLLACIIFFLRRQRARIKCINDPRATHLSFQDRGASFMKEAGEPLDLPAPTPPAHTSPHPGQQVYISPELGVAASTDATRSSGWSRYFAGNEQNLAHNSGQYQGTLRSSYADSTDPNTLRGYPPAVGQPIYKPSALGISTGRRDSDSTVSSLGDSFSTAMGETPRGEDSWSPMEAGPAGSVTDSGSRYSQATIQPGPGGYGKMGGVGVGGMEGQVETEMNVGSVGTVGSRMSGPPQGWIGQENISWLDLNPDKRGLR